MATEGRIDGIKDGFLAGWAHDPDRPGERLELEVSIDDEPLGQCVANVERGDLLSEGIGDGRHGFQVRVRRRLEPGSAHRLAVRALRDGSLLPMAGNYDGDATGDPADAKLVLSADTSPAPPATAQVPTRT